MEAVTQEDDTKLGCWHVQKHCFTKQSRGQWLSMDGQESEEAAHALLVQKGLLSL